MTTSSFHGHGPALPPGIPSDINYHSQSNWENQENVDFEKLMGKMGSYDTAGQQYMFLTVIFYFMSQYFGGETEWPSNAMNNISNVDLYDMQYITNAFSQIYSDAVGGHVPSDADDLVKGAYRAANNLLLDLYTNPIFAGTQLPDEVKSNLATVFGYDQANMVMVPVHYKVDGKSEITDVPQFIDSSDFVDQTIHNWTYGAGLPPGNPEIQEWSAAMQNNQTQLQNTTTLFTDMSSTDQSKENYYYSELKEFLGSWHDDMKDVVSLQQTEIQNELR